MSLTVNDFGGDTKGAGQSSRPADAVVAEIRAKGGIAVANYGNLNIRNVFRQHITVTDFFAWAHCYLICISDTN